MTTLVEPPEGPTSAATFDAAVHRAATALTSTSALREVLRTLAEVTLETTEASRASLFVARDGSFVPAVSLGYRDDRQLWDAFREMPPIVLDHHQERLLAAGEPVPLPDAATSLMLPPGWARRFRVQSAVVVQLAAQGRVCGLLAVDYPRRDRFWDGELARIAAIAALAGIAIHNAQLDEQTRRDQALAAERGRIAEELHDRVGRLFEALHVRAEQLADQAPPDHPWRARAGELARLADGGSFQLERAALALEHLPTQEGDLTGALRGLVTAVEVASGMSVILGIDGDPTPLPLVLERALYRVAYEALDAAWLHGRCHIVRLALTFAPGEVRLMVVDDGAGLRARHRRPVIDGGLLAIRRDLTSVDGTLEVTDLRPHGLRVQVTVPRRAPGDTSPHGDDNITPRG